jgi:glycine cleavage system H protein
MSETRFTKEHEWVRLEDGLAVVGITDHAQQQLGDIVFIELPEPGRTLDAEEPCAVVESVKAASDIYAPIAGRVAEANLSLVDDPSLVNRSPTQDGWFFKLHPANPAALDELMDEAGYTAFLGTL